MIQNLCNIVPQRSIHGSPADADALAVGAGVRAGGDGLRHGPGQQSQLPQPVLPQKPRDHSWTHPQQVGWKPLLMFYCNLRVANYVDMDVDED